MFTTLLNKLRRFDTPQAELQVFCDAIRQAVETDRMGSDAEFAKWVHDEVALNIMQKLAKTMTFDLNVSA